MGGPGAPLRRAIGTELRRRRIAAGLSQAALGEPFTRAFISAVERGHAVPSVPALAVLTARLGTSMAAFFEGVNSEMTGVYNADHGDGPNPPTSGRR